MATGPREPTRGEREEKSGAGAREEVRRREEVSPVGAVPECPFLCAQGVGLDPTPELGVRGVEMSSFFFFFLLFSSIHCCRVWMGALFSLPPP